MSQSLFDGSFSPCIHLDRCFVFRFHCFRKFDETLGRIFAAIEQHIFDSVTQFRIDLIIDFKHLWVDDPHIEASLDGMVQKDCVHRLANRIVTAKRKRNVAHAATRPSTRTLFLDGPNRFDEIDGVVSMLGQTRADC